MAISVTITTLGTQRPPTGRHRNADQHAAEDEAQRLERAGEHDQQRHADADLDQRVAVQGRFFFVCLVGCGRNSM